jgi:hypothetical protein
MVELTAPIPESTCKMARSYKYGNLAALDATLYSRGVKLGTLSQTGPLLAIEQVEPSQHQYRALVNPSIPVGRFTLSECSIELLTDLTGFWTQQSPDQK